MNIFFDVDYTLLAMDNSLRPGTREVFEKLIADGHKLFIWSGVGLRTAEIEKHNLSEFVSDIFVKPIHDFEAGLEKFNVTTRPDFVIDDYPEIVDVFTGVLVRPYFFRSAEDDEMDRVYTIIKDYVETGHSKLVGFRPGVNGTGSTP